MLANLNKKMIKLFYESCVRIPQTHRTRANTFREHAFVHGEAGAHLCGSKLDGNPRLGSGRLLRLLALAQRGAGSCVLPEHGAER